MSELRDAITMLKKLESKYITRQKQLSADLQYDEALRVMQMRKGIEHAIKVIERMRDGQLSISPTTAEYDVSWIKKQCNSKP